MRVTVTAQDIAEGTKTRHQSNQSRKCPVARAIARLTGCTSTTIDGKPSIETVRVAGPYAVLWSWNNQKPIMFPEHARQWIRAFDMGKPVEPFSFECTP